MFFEPQPLEEVLPKLLAIPRQPNEALLVMVAEQQAPDLNKLVAGLRSAGCPFFGGLFPALTAGNARQDAGIAAVAVPIAGKPAVVENLTSSPRLPRGLREVAAGGSTGTRPTAILFVDGLSAGIAEFLRRTYDALGNSVAFLGGGAGSLTLRQQPCVFCADGVFEDAAVIAISPQSCGLGVRHGWQPIAGPLVATRTHRNRIEELNWQPAFPVYRDIVETDSGRPFQRDRFFELAREFPFGLLRDEQESVVRDPIQVDENEALICVGWVPDNSVLHIMKGTPDQLVDAAADAARDACHTGCGQPALSLLIDCISRAIFLGERFTDELDAICKALSDGGASPPIGALTLGEISCRGDGYLEFFNKTAVVGVFRGL